MKAGEQVKDLFHKTDVLGTAHLKKVGEELEKHGSKEKTGFMEKEAEFVKELKTIQGFHLETCLNLLKVSIVALGIEFIWASMSIIKFGCGFGDCENGLICSYHYIKFVQSIYLIHTYISNIKEKQPNQPIGTLNSFLVYLMYFCCLYQYSYQLKEPQSLIHFCVVYPLLDGLTILFSFYKIS